MNPEPAVQPAVCSADELRGLFLFEKLTDEQLGWLCREGRVQLIEPGPVYAEGDPAACFYVLLGGAVVLSRRVGEDEVEVGRTSEPGVYAGAFTAYLGDRVPQVYNNSLRVTEPSRFFVLDAAKFAQLMNDWFPMAVHLLEGLVFGQKNTQQAIGQRERLLALGSLSAGLTHELNNPASAAVRATAALRERVAGMRRKLGMIAAGDRTPAALAGLVDLQEEAAAQVAKAPALSPMEASDREDVIADWLDAHGVQSGWELAAIFTQAGLDESWLDRVAATMAESERRRRRGRRAALAGLHDRVRAADERDRRLGHPDLRPGRRCQAVLAAGPGTVPGGRRARAAGQHPDDARRQDRAGDHRGQGLRPRPARIPAYPGELNQVWTNLIDNAVAAMDGTGTLTVRTALDRRSAAGRVRRHRAGRPGGHPGPDLRAVLHHQAGGRGHRPRARHLLADRGRQASRRSAGGVGPR